MICEICNEDKLRVFSGDRTQKNKKIYLDEKNLRWNGRNNKICPECHKHTKEPNNKSHRKCRLCKNIMTKDRYFNCASCKPILESDEGMF